MRLPKPRITELDLFKDEDGNIKSGGISLEYQLQPCREYMVGMNFILKGQDYYDFLQSGKTHNEWIIEVLKEMFMIDEHPIDLFQIENLTRQITDKDKKIGELQENINKLATTNSELTDAIAQLTLMLSNSAEGAM